MIILFAIFWYLLMAIVVYSFQKQTRCFSTWNTFTVFIGLTLLHHGIYVPFCLGYPTEGLLLPDYAARRFIINLIIMYVFILLGIRFVNITYRFNPYRIETRIRFSGHRYNPIFLWPVLIIFTILLIYMLSVATINLNLPDFLFRTLSAGEYKEARILFAESTSRLQGFMFYIMGIASFALFPLLIFFCFFAKNHKNQPVYKIFFYGLLSLYLYNGLISGHKGTSVIILIGIFICYWIKNKGLRFNLFDKKIVFAVSGFFFGIIPYLYMVQYPNFTYLQALYSTWFRLSIEPNRVLQLYYYAYPDVHPHLLGSSSHLMANISGYSGPPPHTYIPSTIFGLAHNCWNAVFIGDAWADFGYLGTILTSFAVGALLQWYNFWFSRAKKSALALGTYVTLILAASKLSSAGLFSCLLTFGLASSFLIFLILKEMSWLKERPRLSLQVS